MIPTITDLTSSTSISSKDKKALTDTFNDLIRTIDEVGEQDGVKIVRRGSNDDNEVAFKATMNRVLAKHNVSKAKKPRDSRNRVNDNSNVSRAVEKTMEEVVDRYSHVESENWLKYSKGNDNDTIPWQDGIVTEPVVHSSAYENTIDRIMSLHNSHDDKEWIPSNDNKSNSDIAESYMSKMKERHFNSTHGEADNDNKKPAAKRTKSDNTLLKEIAKNTDETAKNVEKLAELFDDLGIDSLRAKERALEAGNGNMASTSDGYSSMAREGKEDNGNYSKPGNKDKSITERLIEIGATGASGLIASFIGHEMGGSGAPNTPGGGSDAGVIPSGKRHKPAKGERAKYQVMLYDAFKKQGYTHEGAKTMVAQVGRENNFNPEHLFGYHKDPKNGALNAGMISWQKDRATKLLKFMSEKGLVDEKSGRLQNSQASLDAQAEFLDMEMRNNKKMKSARSALFDPNKDYKQIERGIGKDVISWRIDDPKYRSSGYSNQNRAYGEISAATDKITGITETGKTISAPTKNGQNLVSNSSVSDNSLNATRLAKDIENTVRDLVVNGFNLGIRKGSHEADQEIKKQTSNNKGAQTNAASTQDATRKSSSAAANVNVNNTTVNNNQNSQKTAPKRAPETKSSFWDIFDLHYGS